MSSNFNLPSLVNSPQLTPNQESQLVSHALDWSLAHGLLYRTIEPSLSPSLTLAPSSPFPFKAVHAPFSLYPSPLPKAVYDKALHLAPLYNSLFHSCSQDFVFWNPILKALSQVDSFTNRIYQIYLEFEHAKERGDPIQVIPSLCSTFFPLTLMNWLKFVVAMTMAMSMTMMAMTLMLIEKT